MIKEAAIDNERVCEKRLRQLLATLLLVLTFEGLARKIAPPGLGVPIFLLKDAIIAVMTCYVMQLPFPPALAFLWKVYKVLAVLFVPLILVTGWHDPLLAVFGMKQYLLYPLVAFATFLALHRLRKEEIFGIFRWISLLIIPTAMLAAVQLRLPATHWLNESVSGESLEGFSAAGHLRVSSTFSFVAQYCIFLNAQTFIVMIALANWRQSGNLWKFTALLLLPVFVFSCFITGSRGAVAGNTAIILLACALSLARFQVRTVLQVGLVIVTLYAAAMGVQYFSPDTTAAYSERESGHLVGISSEIQDRVFGSFFGLAENRALNSCFGNGLGVMSNGSDTFSSYAAIWRANMWTETDFATTLFEGGYYLVIIWYGFRFYVIFMTARRFLADVVGDYVVPGTFVQAFVIVMGFLGTLAIQPPVAIWWWFGVGTSLLFWWKSVGPKDPEIKPEDLLPPPTPPVKFKRGRSLYAEAIQSRK